MIKPIIAHHFNRTQHPDDAIKHPGLNCLFKKREEEFHPQRDMLDQIDSEINKAKTRMMVKHEKPCLPLESLKLNLSAPPIV